MARVKGLVLGIWLLCCCLLFSACDLLESTPRMTGYQQVAQLLPDGSLLVTESVDYTFDEEAAGVDRLLLPVEGQQIEIDSASWQVQGQAIASLHPAQDSENPAAGTYRVAREQEGLRFTAVHPQAAGSRATLRLRYLVKTPAQRYLDIGTLLWQPLGNQGLPGTVENVLLRLQLAVSEAGQMRASLFESPDNARLEAGEGGITLTLPQLPAGRAVAVRVDFPQILLAHQTAEPAALLAIRSENQRQVLDALSLGLSWCIACWVVGFILTIYFYQTADKDPDNVPAPPSSRMMGVTGPAELSNLMPFATGAGPHDFSAMLLHLIHRGHLRIYPPGPGLPLNEDTVALARIERIPAPRDMLMDGEHFLIHYLVDVLGDGKGVALSALRDVKPREFKKDFRAWRKLVDRQLARRPWFVDLTQKRLQLALMGAVMIAGSAFVALILHAHSSAWWGAPMGVWLIFYAFTMRKRTPEAIHEIQIWQTFGRKLLVGGVGRVDSIAQWERILLYAEAMRMGAEAIDALAERVEAGATYPDARQATFLAWGLLDYPDELRYWFRLLTKAVRPK